MRRSVCPLHSRHEPTSPLRRNHHRRRRRWPLLRGRAGQRGCRVALIDHAETIGEDPHFGRRPLHFTNVGAGPTNYLSQNPHFCRSALSRFTPRDFITLVTKHRIAFHEKTLGQLFCDESSQQIIDMLLGECRRGGVQLMNPLRVGGLRVRIRKPRFTSRNVSGELRAPVW